MDNNKMDDVRKALEPYADLSSISDDQLKAVVGGTDESSDSSKLSNIIPDPAERAAIKEIYARTGTDYESFKTALKASPLIPDNHKDALSIAMLFFALSEMGYT